jgi:hypothetical protein
MTNAVRLTGEAREVVLAEAQAVYAMASDAAYRERLSGLVGAASEGEVGDEDAETLDELLELGLQSGRIRALYGPGGETAALGLYRRLPRGAAVVESTSEVSAALRALEGRELGSIELRAVGPGAFALSLSAGELELSLKLDRQGARLTSVGV